MARRRSLQIGNQLSPLRCLPRRSYAKADAKRARRPQGDGYIFSGAFILLQNASGQFFRKTLKLFRPDLERKSKDTTLKPKKYSAYEQEIFSWRDLIHRRIRALQSDLSGADQGPG